MRLLFALSFLAAGLSHAALVISGPSSPIPATAGTPTTYAATIPLLVSNTDSVFRIVVGPASITAPAGFSGLMGSQYIPGGAVDTPLSGIGFSILRSVGAGTYTVSFGLSTTNPLSGAQEASNLISAQITVPAQGAVPEPASCLLVGSGMLACGLVFRRRFHA